MTYHLVRNIWNRGGLQPVSLTGSYLRRETVFTGGLPQPICSPGNTFPERGVEVLIGF
jgi:hypothetical protein